MKKIILFGIVLVLMSGLAFGLEFEKHDVATSVDAVNSVFAIDVDFDGDIDILSTSETENTVTWYENDGSESFTPHNISTSANGARSVFAIDVDTDTDIDVLSASYLDNTIAWYENDGSESFTPHTIISNGAPHYDYSSHISVFAIDLDGDTDIDVLSASVGGGVKWYENDGSESFTPHTLTSGDSYSVFAIDLDGDTDIDIISTIGLNTVIWFENDGSENFTLRNLYAANFPTSVFAIDVDTDTDIDVLSASFFDDTIAWYENKYKKIDINIYDRETNELLSNETQIIVLETENKSTSNGTTYFMLLPGEYSIYAIHEGYGTEIRYIEVSDEATINFYLLNLTGENTGSLYVTNTDDYSRTVSGAEDSLLEYDYITKTFNEVSECYSNKNGECVFYIELNKKLYVVTGRKNISGVMYYDSSSTEGELISEEGYIIPLFLLTSEDFNSMIIRMTKITNIAQSFDENTNISDINVSFYTLDNSLAYVCVEYDRIFSDSKVSVAQYCSNSSEGIITGPPTELNLTYAHEAKIFQLIDGEEIIFKKYYYPKKISGLNILKDMIFLNYLVMAVVLGLLAAAYWLKNITWLFIAYIIFSWLCVGNSIITGTGAFLQTMLSVFAIAISRKKKDSD